MDRAAPSVPTATTAAGMPSKIASFTLVLLNLESDGWLAFDRANPILGRGTQRVTAPVVRADPPRQPRQRRERPNCPNSG